VTHPDFHPITYDTLKSLIEQRGVHEVFGAAGEGWGIEQNPYELATAITVLISAGIQAVLEVGTGYRAGLARFMAQDLGWNVTSVDVTNYMHMIEGIHFITGSWAENERPVLASRFDLVIIDADHRYEAVRLDHAHYVPYATKFILFHDICGLRDCEGAARYWREIAYTKTKVLKAGYREVIADSPQRSGIGMIDLTQKKVA
jgi:hypothetical protein